MLLHQNAFLFFCSLLLVIVHSDRDILLNESTSFTSPYFTIFSSKDTVNEVLVQENDSKSDFKTKLLYYNDQSFKEKEMYNDLKDYFIVYFKYWEEANYGVYLLVDKKRSNEDEVKVGFSKFPEHTVLQKFNTSIVYKNLQDFQILTAKNDTFVLMTHESKTVAMKINIDLKNNEVVEANEITKLKCFYKDSLICIGKNNTDSLELINFTFKKDENNYTKEAIKLEVLEKYFDVFDSLFCLINEKKEVICRSILFDPIIAASTNDSFKFENIIQNENPQIFKLYNDGTVKLLISYNEKYDIFSLEEKPKMSFDNDTEKKNYSLQYSTKDGVMLQAHVPLKTSLSLIVQKNKEFYYRNQKKYYSDTCIVGRNKEKQSCQISKFKENGNGIKYINFKEGYQASIDKEDKFKIYVEGSTINKYTIEYLLEGETFFRNLELTIRANDCKTYYSAEQLYCQSCDKDSNFYLLKPDNECILKDETEENKYYFDQTKGIAFICRQDGCETCEYIHSNLTICTECKDDKFLEKNICTENCSNTTYQLDKNCLSTCPQGYIIGLSAVNDKGKKKCLKSQNIEENQIKNFENIKDDEEKKKEINRLAEEIRKDIDNGIINDDFFRNYAIYASYIQVYNTIDILKVKQEIIEEAIKLLDEGIVETVALSKITGFISEVLSSNITNDYEIKNNLLTFYLKALNEENQPISIEETGTLVSMVSNLFNAIEYEQEEYDKLLNKTHMSISTEYFEENIMPKTNSTAQIKEIISNLLKLYFKENNEGFFSQDFSFFKTELLLSQSTEFSNQFLKLYIYPKERKDISSLSLYDMLKMVKSSKADFYILFPTEEVTTLKKLEIGTFSNYTFIGKEARSNVSVNFLSIEPYDSNNEKIEVKDLSTPIKIIIKKRDYEFRKCLFYDEEAKKMSNAGCNSEDIGDYVVCSCNHLTMFTLGNFQPGLDKPDKSKQLFSRVLSELRIFRTLNAKNSVPLYIYSGIFLLYIILFCFTITKDYSGIDDWFLRVMQQNFSRCFDFEETLIMVKQMKRDFKNFAKTNTDSNQRESELLDNIVTGTNIIIHEPKEAQGEECIEMSVVYPKANPSPTHQNETNKKDIFHHRNAVKIPTTKIDSLSLFTKSTTVQGNYFCFTFSSILVWLIKCEFYFYSLFFYNDCANASVITRSNLLTIQTFRLFNGLNFLMIFSKVDDNDFKVFINTRYSIGFIWITLLINEVLYIIFRIIFCKKKVFFYDKNVSLDKLKYKEILMTMIAYIILVVYLGFCVLNSTWIYLNIKKYNLYSDCFVNFGFLLLFEFVYEVVILILKSFIYTAAVLGDDEKPLCIGIMKIISGLPFIFVSVW